MFQTKGWTVVQKSGNLTLKALSYTKMVVPMVWSLMKMVVLMLEFLMVGLTEKLVMPVLLAWEEYYTLGSE